MDDCVKVQKAQKCDAAWDRCETLDLQYPNMVPYRKGCITEELCQTFCVSGPDGEAGSKHCKLSCCQGNFFN